jgi:iron complex transport system substrate-binding protein
MVGRRIGIALCAVLMLVAGCGGGVRPDAKQGNTDVATGGKQFTTADQDTAKLGADVGPGVFPRTITHARGTTRLAAKPQRVVVLDSGELDQVLALGLTPVGVATLNGGQLGYLADRIAGVPVIGDINSLNLEAIAAAKPDLILGSKLRADQLYDKLTAIAPTVFSIRPGFPWKENLLLAGAALGEETKAVELLNDYQRKADEVKAALKGRTSVSLVRFMPGKIRLYGNLSFIGVILRDVGLARPPAQDINELAAEVSAERLDGADGDWIFYSSYGPPGATAQGGVVNGELWNRLGGVKAGHARAVDDEVWFLGLGPLGAQRVLADLRTILAA